MNPKRCASCVCGALARNPATTRMLGLCPLLAVSQTAGQSLTCAMLFAAIVVISGLVAAGLRHTVSWRLRPMYHALLASATTSCVIALAQLVHYPAVAALGIYPALIAGNCLVLSHIQETAERRPVRVSLASGCRDVAAIAGFLVLFGAARELLARGTIFGVGSAVAEGPLPIMAGAPGALLLLAIVLAAVNARVARDRAGAAGAEAFKPAAPAPIRAQ